MRTLNLFKFKLRKTFPKLYVFYSGVINQFKKGNYQGIEKEEIKILLKKENPIVLEIGANDGKDSKEFLEKFQNIQLYCFEPDPRKIHEFKERVNDERCRLFEIAISDKDENKEFLLSWNTLENCPADSSTLKKPTEQLNTFPHIVFSDNILVEAKKLDTWSKENNINEIDFMWVDVEGSEKELILGGLETINKSRYFYTEFRDKEFYEGQIPLKEILEMLPNFKLLKIYGNNALLVNTKEIINDGQ